MLKDRLGYQVSKDETVASLYRILSAQLADFDKYGHRKVKTFHPKANPASTPNSLAKSLKVGCFVPVKRIAIAHAAKVTNATLGKSVPNHAANGTLIPDVREACSGESQPCSISKSGKYSTVKIPAAKIISIAARALTAPARSLQTVIARPMVKTATNGKRTGSIRLDGSAIIFALAVLLGILWIGLSHQRIPIILSVLLALCALGLMVTSLILDKSSMPRKLSGEQLDNRPSQPIGSRNFRPARHYRCHRLLQIPETI